MKNVTKGLLIIASLLLIVTFVVPLWHINLVAPQYPEGLGLYIWLDTITGQEPNHLRLINSLNHYIGMREIVPESIPELKVLPFLVAFLSVFGMLNVILNKKALLYVWLALLVLVATGGMIDFYLWEYDYGHNLDLENAAIKIPGMSYQPPLIGSKKLLNFTAYSYPSAGGWIALISFFLVLSAIIYERGANSEKTAIHQRGKINKSGASIVFAMLFLISCTPSPEPIAYGTDGCTNCKMTIVDSKFGAELLTKKGKVYKYDSIECLASAYIMGTIAHDKIHSLVVADSENSERFIEIKKATFLQSEKLRSPMGLNLSAYSSLRAAQAAQEKFGGGAILGWDKVLKIVKSGWVEGVEKQHPNDAS